MGKLTTATASMGQSCAMAKLALENLEEMTQDISNNFKMKEQLIEKYRKKAKQDGSDPNDVTDDPQMKKLADIAKNLATKYKGNMNTLENCYRSMDSLAKTMESLLSNRSLKARLNVIKNKQTMKKAEEVLKDAKQLCKTIEKMLGWTIKEEEVLKKSAERMRQLQTAAREATDISKESRSIVRDVEQLEASSPYN